MVKVAEILELEIFNNFVLIAGEKGLQNEITNTTILEYEPFVGDYEAFYPGDFILTSLFYAKDAPQLILTSFQALHRKKVAGIAIKQSFYQEIPQEVIEYADQMDLPLFVFRDTYMENIILTINDLIQARDDYEAKEQELLDFYSGHSEDEVIQMANRIYNYPMIHYAIAYLTPVHKEKRVASTFRQLYMRRKNYLGKRHFGIAKYKNGILLVMSVQEKELEHPKVSVCYQECMQQMKLDPNQYYCGCSQITSERNEFKKLLDQAFDANRIAVVEKRHCSSYESLGIWRFITSLARDPLVKEQCERAMEILQTYDQRYSSELVKTLQIYVKNNGKLSATAKEMYQHVNTIRYRVEKAAELLQIEDSYESLYLLMQLNRIKD